ncbi:hypothetical protein TNCT_338691 [Trichonephila clavata]|uniref:Uncharacterized protein n=1 Tax=Trichonephila clavata TaxID=2740835 RepID=A0A8X6KQK5_TRICU|nr:hypothetical protein TNCT_338691 [Trichonephila clavata]
MLIRSVQWVIKCKKTSSQLFTRDFPSAEVQENNSDIQHAETAEDISKDPIKELGSSSVQGVPSTDVAVPDLSVFSYRD